MVLLTVIITTVNDFAGQLKRLDSALIFCHARPDGDTLSCAFGLYFAFKRLGKRVDIVCADPFPKVFEPCFPFCPSNKVDLSYDNFIAVDCPTLELLGSLSTQFTKKRSTFLIDHHLSNRRYAKNCLVDVRPACALIVYDVIKAMGVKIDAEIAQALLYGICTDTGNFAHDDCDSKTFLAVSEILSHGASISLAYDRMFRSQTKERAKLYAETISKMRFYHDNKVAIIAVRQSDLEKFGLTADVTDGFVDYTMTVLGVEVGISMLEFRKEVFRISFRSKNVDCNQIAQTFGGGGHKKASGAVIAGIYEDVIDKLIYTCGNYL